MQPQRAEVNRFPNHRASPVNVCIVDKIVVLIVGESSKPQENTIILESLTKSKAFKSLFDVLEFSDRARKIATQAIFEVAQQYSPQCCLVNHVVGQVVKKNEDTFTFSKRMLRFLILATTNCCILRQRSLVHHLD